MTTLSHAVPTLEGIVLAANLIILGTVEEGPLSSPEYSTDPPQVHSQFWIAVEDTLRGRAPAESVSVRVLGGQVDGLRTEWTCSMREGERVLLCLAPYYAVDRGEDTFVPYFRSCFPVSPEGIIDLSARPLLAPPRAPMTVDTLRVFIQSALQNRKESNARLPERDSVDTETTPGSAPGSSIQDGEPGGARRATLK